MADYYRKVDEIPDEELEFPEPKPTKQYKTPIGPEKPVKESIAQRIAKVAAPGLVGESEALGKGAAKAIAGKAKGGVVRGIQNMGARVGHLIETQPAPPGISGSLDVPVWLRDTKGGKSKHTRIPGDSIPSWVLGGGLPWDQPRQHSDVERITVTRVHADGSRTTTHRNVPAKGQRQSLPRQKKPSWIKF